MLHISVALFALDPATADPDIVPTTDNRTTICTSFDDRVVLGNIGFSRGCHYWEVTTDRYDGNPDPAVMWRDQRTGRGAGGGPPSREK